MSMSRHGFDRSHSADHHFCVSKRLFWLPSQVCWEASNRMLLLQSTSRAFKAIFLQLSLLLRLTILALFFECTIGSGIETMLHLVWWWLFPYCADGKPVVMKKCWASPVCNWYGLCCHLCATIPQTLLKALGWLPKALRRDALKARSLSLGFSFAQACRFSVSCTHSCVAILLYLRIAEIYPTVVHWFFSNYVQAPVMSKHINWAFAGVFVHWGSLPTQPAVGTDFILSC
jgi:hypothetical protein